MTTDFAAPRLVHAIFKAHACCPEDECEDSLSRFVSQAEVKLVSGKNAENALAAEKILGRLAKVFEESGRSRTLEYGDLSVAIALVVLGKDKDRSLQGHP